MGKLGQAHIWVSQSRMLKLLATDRPRVVNLCRAAQATRGLCLYGGTHHTRLSEPVGGLNSSQTKRGWAAEVTMATDLGDNDTMNQGDNDTVNQFPFTMGIHWDFGEVAEIIKRIPMDPHPVPHQHPWHTRHNYKPTLAHYYYEWNPRTHMEPTRNPHGTHTDGPAFYSHRFSLRSPRLL